MKKFIIVLVCMVFISASYGQPLAKQQYDITKEKVLYTIGYAHLDTQWNWDYPTTINEYIKNTMEDNFEFFEKYPDYVFNFEGAIKYMWMKEYYPVEYENLTVPNLPTQIFAGQRRWSASVQFRLSVPCQSATL